MRFFAGSNLLYNLGFFVRAVRSAPYFIMNGKHSHRIFVMQVLFTFVEALGIAVFLALGIGAAVIAIGMPALAGFSQEKFIYPLLITIIMREAGPLLVAFIIIARSATAIATELATIVISHEVEAYISVGVDPVEHLAVPRLLAVTFSSFLLNVYFSLAGLAGSFLVVKFIYPLPANVYFASLFSNLHVLDVIISFVKSIVFGVLISIIAISAGFSVEHSSTEVPIAGLKAVGVAFIWCIASDIALSAVYYALK
ncbi:MAG: ABC transporter permease [Spirochaetaceae bacterium]|jgi:phospholipid/cholesterol/gamma-HCH transport system permease protein|nr:ABC transporter permease [Spirochaetaceae bacterium]